MVIYDILHKRKVFLDAFLEGLEVFHLKAAVCAFPALFEGLFVASPRCSAQEVLDILQYDENLDTDGERVVGYLENTISELDEEGVFGVHQLAFGLGWAGLENHEWEGVGFCGACRVIGPYSFPPFQD